jgi:hypothetical protein
VVLPAEPEGIVLLQDVAPARWIEERLWPWGNSSGTPGVPVGSILPEGFAAYARVLHPASRGGGKEPVRWAIVASWTGRTVHPLMQFGGISNLIYPYRPDWGEPPIHGRLPRAEGRIIVDLLREFTGTPDSCLLCLWDGYGFLDPARYQNVPRVNADRKYLLFRGSLDLVDSFRNTVGQGQSPNLWWPEDRAWCVATDIDLYDTYVGGSEECIQRIFDCPDLEAFPVTINDRIDAGADTINVSDGAA